MKRIFILVFVLGIIFSPRIYWEFKSETPLDVLIIDKTVPKTDYREHNALLWVLNNEKIVKKNGELYDISLDYFGYDPVATKSTEPYRYSEEKDFIYIADTYGVYTDDLQEVAEGERSELIYGGMSLAEWKEIMLTKTKDNILVAEYNSFATPTSETVREQMEKDLNVDWSGWIGRFFSDLNSSEVPPWLIRNYENQSNKKWDFDGGGLAFVDNSDQVIILPERDMRTNVQFKLTEIGKEKFKEVNIADYAYWFDIVKPASGAKVLAEYDIDLTENGKTLLEQNGIPTTFPAVIYQEEKQIYYFSGDYADYTKDNLMKWQSSENFLQIFSKDETNFIWAVYVPLMKTILKEAK